MSEICQSEWIKIVDESAYTHKAAAEEARISYGLFRKYLLCEVVPRSRNKEKVFQAMAKIKNEKRIPFHPSYGYATEEQIEKLKSMGMCPDRDYLLTQIAKQNSTGGKAK